MKRMWIDLKPEHDLASLTKGLKELGTVQEDTEKSARLILTFHNQSPGGLRMAGFRLSQDYIQCFEDFGMIPEGG
jgi:hypothetical protein